MYSVVLMAALAAGSANQDCFFGGGWGGGGYSASYAGWSCHGCYGCYGGCTGCYGGGYAVGWGGGYGGGYGVNYGGGYGVGYGGGGCYGCYGGCFGGCYGGCYGGCHGCYGGYYGGSSYGVINYGAQTMPAAKGPEQIPQPTTKKDGGEIARAKVVIDVPVNTALYIDNQLMPEKSGKRTFVTPELQPNQTYYYDIKLVANGGQQQIQTTRVVLRPGQEVAAAFTATQNSTVVVADNNNR